MEAPKAPTIEAPKAPSIETPKAPSIEAPKAPRGVGCGEGAVPPPQKIFDYWTLKWRVLVHI